MRRSKNIVPVPANDREWLLGQLKRVKQEYKLPVLAIDYVSPGAAQPCARNGGKDTRSGIHSLGDESGTEHCSVWARSR